MKARCSTCLVQRRPAVTSALRLMPKLLKKQGYTPKLLVTDKLRSYASAFRQLRLTCRHEQSLRQNNRAENSHQVVRPGAQVAALQIGQIRPTFPEHVLHPLESAAFSRRTPIPAHLPIFTTGTARYFGLPSRKRERVPEPPQSVTFFILFAGAPPGAGSLACWGDYSCA